MWDAEERDAGVYDARSPNPESRPSGKLPEEPHVVVEEAAQVVDAVAQHREALHAQAEGEAGVALRVDADVAQHVRVPHAAAEQFQPARRAIRLLPGGVDFGRRTEDGNAAGRGRS